MSEFDPDAFLAQPMPEDTPPAPTEVSTIEGDDFNPDAFLEEMNQQQYGGLGQQAIAGLEGVASGVAGPLAPMAERALGVNPEDIRGRAEANPWTHGIGEAAGLVGGALTGTGEAAVMSKAGRLAQEAVGLADLSKGASYGARVGSAAVQQAAEMAVLQSGNEVGKIVLQDPNLSAQTAISDIGLAAALGGAGGAFMAGAVSPLWNATLGPKLDKALNGLKDHLDGKTALILPEQIENAEKTLGIQLSPATRAGISGNPRTAQIFNELRESQNKAILEDIKNLHTGASRSVADSLGVGAEDIANYSENQAGHDVIDTFKKEYNAKYEPVQKQYDALKTANEGVHIPDEERLKQYSKIIERGQAFGATGSPQQRLFDEYGERLLAQDTIGHTDKLITEINNELKKAYRAGDNNTAMAFREIKSSIQDFQDQQINRIAGQSEKLGIEGARSEGKSLIAERAAASKAYADVAKISDEMSQHMGLGEFRGVKNLLMKLADKKSPEQVLRSLSPKGNADIIPFLEKHFPETLQRIKENETKQLIKPAVLGAKGEDPINIKILSNAVDKGMAGKAEHIKFALPPGALEKIQAAKTLINALPEFKSSGTAGWTAKLMRHMPASAASAVSLITGHNMIGGYIAGEIAQLLGRDAPDAIKLGLLRFLASDKPVTSEGFKSMVDFLHATQNGEKTIAKATSNVFKPGASVLTPSQMPSSADIAKLDKLVAKSQDKPDALMNAQNGGIGHYLPSHQAAVAQTSMTAVQYLQTLKPQPYKPGPLDRPIAPSPAQEARYHRALEIAQQPAVVMQHIKDGTLQTSDLQDLKAMYPSVYDRMSQKITNEIATKVSDEDHIPYRTKVGLSLFLGQPLDSSMLPASIMAAQPKMQRSPVSLQNRPDSQEPMKGRKGTSSLGKSNKSYQTPGQASEARRINHD